MGVDFIAVVALSLEYRHNTRKVHLYRPFIGDGFRTRIEWVELLFISIDAKLATAYVAY